MELPRFSQMLCSRREQLGLTIDQASRVLKLKEQVLIAFEEGDFASIPKSGYAQGMLSSYARYLGLNPREVVDQFSEDLYEFSNGTTSHELRRRTRASRGDTGVISGTGVIGGADATGSMVPPNDNADQTGSFDTTSTVNVRSTNRGRPSPLVSSHVPDVTGSWRRPEPSWRSPSSDESGYISSPVYGSAQGYASSQGGYGTTPIGRGSSRPNYADPSVYRAGQSSYGSSSYDTGQASYTAPQPRPYTSRVPQQSQRPNRAYSRRAQSGPYAPDDVDIYAAGSAGGASRGRGDVVRRRVQPNQYEDDLVFDEQTTAFESASSVEGRRSSRNIASTERPKVARSSREERRALRERSQERAEKPGIFERIGSFFSDSRHMIGLVMALVAVALIVIIGMSVRSCVIASSGRRRAVTEVTSSGGSAISTSTSGSATTSTSTAATQAEPTETKVVVSLADGAVSWVEIESDGKSIVADTITGPWEQELIVDDSMTVQVGDITAVSVTKNGDPVQFSSKASGVGTITIEGSHLSSSTDDGEAQTTQGEVDQSSETIPVDQQSTGEGETS